jgi:hypothetical protein
MRIDFYSSFLPKHHKPYPFITSFRRAKYINHNISFHMHSRLLSRSWSLAISWNNASGRY